MVDFGNFSTRFHTNKNLNFLIFPLDFKEDKMNSRCFENTLKNR